MARGASAADAESYRPELLGEDEPRYLRRQKPVEIRRKKFSGRGWPFYRRALVWSVIGLAGTTAAVMAGRFLLYSPQMLLLKFDQGEVICNNIIHCDTGLLQFSGDGGPWLISNTF